MQHRLHRALGTPVDVVALEQAEAQPSLLADVLREGRVLIDRDDLWGALQQRRAEIETAGAREDELTMTRARAALADARERLARVDKAQGLAQERIDALEVISDISTKLLKEAKERGALGHTHSPANWKTQRRSVLLIAEQLDRYIASYESCVGDKGVLLSA